MFRKGKSAVRGDPKEIWNRIEAEKGVEQEEVTLKISLMKINQEEGAFTFAWIERRQSSD